MNLLKLSPESDRLRRLTRAYAAGEISTLAYRKIRSQVVEGFDRTQDHKHYGADDTQPRFEHRSRTDNAETQAAPYLNLRTYPALGVLGFALGLVVVAAAVWVML